MNIAVLTPDRDIFQGAISSVKVPGVNGEFQVLNNHAPIVSALEEGKVEIVTAGGEYTYFDLDDNASKTASGAGQQVAFLIEGGFVEVLNNEVSLLVQGVRRM
ncbi:MAG: F0F1 ATP synthase subunit epsilon [Bacteroidota bacterium]